MQMNSNCRNTPKSNVAQDGYRLLFEANPLPMWVYDLSTLRFLAVNEAAIAHYGYSLQEFLSMTAKDIRPPADVAALMERVSGRGEEVRHSRLRRHLKKDGSLIWVEITSRPILFEGARARLVLAMDVTERKRTEEDLRKSESRFRRLAESNMIGITIGNESGRIEYANDAFLKMVGYTRGELDAGLMRWDHLVPPDQRNVLDVIRRQLRTSGVSQPLETVRIHKDGHRVPVLIGVARLEAEEGLAICFMLDITLRRRTEEALRTETEQLQTISKVLSAYIASGNWQKTSSVFLAGALRQTASECGFVGAVVNGQALRILARGGAVLDQTDNRTFCDNAMKKDEEQEYLELTNLDTLFGEVILTGKPVLCNALSSNPCHGIVPAGHPPLRHFLGVPIVMSERVVGMIGVANRPGGYTLAEQNKLNVLAQMAAVLFDSYKRQDDEAVLQEQLRQAQKMEAIGRLAGGVAHDFNNLLTVINGHSQLLLDRTEPCDRRRDHIEEILKAGERAGALTRQLLAFSRRQVLQSQILDLNYVVAGAEKLLRRLIGEDIELKTDLAADLGRVKADPGQVEQVIMNLIVNARDAMLHGGKVVIKTANVELDEDYARHHKPTAPGSYVMLSMSDTGLGMDSETRSHIFEPFFTTKEPGKGTGLGLATVHGIVTQSGGLIKVNSEPGQGASFEIYLPRVSEMVEEVLTRTEPLHVADGSETVLLVEDEKAVRDLAAGVLRRHGYKVLHEANAERALRAAEGLGRPIDLLLTDVVMPLMSGWSLAKHLSSLQPGLKVLYMSGYTGTAVEQHGVLPADTHFLQKPFTAGDLARKVREVLDPSNCQVTEVTATVL